MNEKSSHHKRVDQLLSHLKALHESKHLNMPGWAMVSIDKWLTEDLNTVNFRKILGQWKGKVSMQEAMEWAQARQLGAKQAVEREQERSRTGFTIVMTHRDGRQVTQGQEYQGRWSRAMALQQALEQWEKPGAGRRPGP